MAMLPFLQWRHYYPVTDFYTEWVAGILGLCASLACLGSQTRIPLVAFVPLALSLVVGLQHVLGFPGYDSQFAMGMFYFVWAFLVAMLGRTLRQEFGLAETALVLSWFIYAGGMLDAAAAIVQHYHVARFLSPVVTPDFAPTVYGNLSQQNHFSDYVSLSMVSLIHLAATKRMPSLAAILSAPLLLFVLAMSGSRSSWIYLAAISLLAAAYFWKTRNRVLLVAAFMLIPCYFFMQWLAHFLSMEAGGLVMTSADRMQSLGKDSGIRAYLWREAWEMFLAHPFLGIGFGQYAWHHFMNGPVYMNPNINGLYTHAHDIMLQFLAETGLVGGGIFLFGLLFWMKRISAGAGVHSWWFFSMLAVLAIHSLDEYPLWYAQFLGIFMLLLGMGDGRSVSFSFGARAVIGVAVFSFFLLMAGLMRDYLDLEGLLYPRYHSGKPPLEPDVLYGKLYGFRKGTLLEPYVAFSMAEMFEPDRENLPAKLEYTRKAVRFSPSGMMVYRYAAYLAMNGESRAAALQVERSSWSEPDLLGEARNLYSGLAARMPRQFDPLVTEVDMKIKERSIAFHHQ